MLRTKATLFGILDIAQKTHNQYPPSVVVIQSLLPQQWPSDNDDCSLDEPNHSFLWSKREDEKNPCLWPGIQRINAQLREFCAKHEYAVFFDVPDVFIEKSSIPEQPDRIDRHFMPNCQHLSLERYKVLGDAIYDEYNRIVLDEEYDNRKEYRDNSKQLQTK